MVPDDLRRLIKAGKRGEVTLTANIFNEMQKDVELNINDQTYASFLQSDMFIKYVENICNPQNLPSSSSSSDDGSRYISRSSTLPTLHEDTELVDNELDMSNEERGASISLTKDSLMATQIRRLEFTPSR